MSFLSGLGNLFHTIGHLITGDDDNQPQQQPQVVRPTQSAPQFQQPQAPALQRDPNNINLAPLFKPNNQIAPASSLQRAPQQNQPQPQQQPQQQQAPHENSLFHDITHNSVTNAIGTGAKAVGGAAAAIPLGALRVGEGVVQGAADLPNLAVHAANFIPRKIAGDKSVVNRVLSDQNTAFQKGTNEIDKPLNWLGEKTDEAQQAYASGNPVDRDIYKGAQVAGNVAAVAPAAASLLVRAPAIVNDAGKIGAGVRAINDFSESQKAASPIVQGIRNITAGLTKAPDEVGVGLKSANPNQVNDAVEQGNQRIAQAQPPVEVDNQPAYQRAPGKAAAAAQKAADTEQAATALGVGPSPLDEPAIQHQQNIQAVIDQGNSELNDWANANPNHSPQELQAAKDSITQQVTEQVNKLQEARRGEVAATPPPDANAGVEPVSGQSQPTRVETLPQQSSTPPPVSAPPSSPVEPPTAIPQEPQLASPAIPEGQPIGKENLSLPNNVAQTGEPVNPPLSDRMAPNAPNVRPELEKGLGDASLKAGDPTKHYVLNNDELNQAAERTVAATSPEEILTKYSGVPKLDAAADLAHAKASMPVLAKLSHDENPQVAEAAKNAISNIWEGAEKGVSKAGRTMNYAQSMYDALPKEAKVSLTIRTLDRARDAAGLPKIADDVAGRADVEQKLGDLLDRGEVVQEQLATTEGDVVKIQDNLGNEPNISRADAKAQLSDLKGLQRQKDLLDLQAAAQNAETLQYYNSLLPGKASAQTFADYARTSMLTAPSGRVNNLFNVGGNALYEIARSLPQAMLNKVVNLVKGAGTTEDKSLLNRGLTRGFKQGLRTVKGELSGKQYNASAAPTELKSSNNYELAHVNSGKGLGRRVGNAVNTLVKTPSNVLGGAIRDSQLIRLARQEGQKAGYTGRDLKIYTQARAVVPSKQMIEKAQLLQDQVSHMNKNPLAQLFSGFGRLDGASGSTKGVLGIIKNTFLAFPKYPATFVWNTLTDRNVLADTVKFAKAAKAGDLNGLTKALSGGGIDTGLMYVGYHLAQQGIITNKDADGYNDAGAYFHVGDRYIPLGLFGVQAEGLLGGFSMFNAFNKGGNPVNNFFKSVGNTIGDTIKMGGAQSLVGADNQAIQATQNAIEGKDKVTYGDAAAQVGGEALGTYIPGALGDVNAVLNQTNLNPTHDAALTKVTKGQQGVTTSNGQPSTAKAIVPSEVNVLKNRIPFLSQKLPRNVDKASQDLVDRVTRGNHTGVPQAAELQKTQAETAVVKSKYDQGIPIYKPAAGTVPKGYSFSNTLNDDIQTGAYDKAIAGLQDQLGVMNKPGPEHIPPSAKQAVQDHISQLQVFKATGADMKLVNAYSGTTLSQWRAMGDSTSSSYNPGMYQKLYALDQALTAKGVSGGSIKTAGNKSTPKFYASTSGSGSGANKAAARVRSNQVGSLPSQTRENFIGQLTAKPINVNIPQVKLTAPDSLIKKHAISVASPRGNYN